MAESKKRKTARERLTSLLGDFPQGFNAGMLAGIPGWAGDMAYLLQEYPRALLTDTPLRPPVEYAGTTDSIAKAAGHEIPGTLSGQLGAAVGGLLSPGPGDLAAFAKLPAMFLGVKAATANQDALTLAKTLEKAGATRDEIWKATGELGQPWMKGPDGEWRFEISDQAPKITDEVFDSIKESKRFEGPMRNALPHEGLFAAYPDTADIQSGFYAWKTPEGSYEGASDTIMAGGPGTTSQKSAALHELQHAVQQREGFARGGSPGEFASGPMFSRKAIELASDLSQYLTGGLGSKPAEIVAAVKYGDPTELATIVNRHGFESVDDALRFLSAEDVKRTPFGQYERLAGEAEARNVQSRMNMSLQDRINTPPWMTLDVPEAQLIVRKGLLDGAALSIPFWHGSPHKFDAFDLSKMGTGEGAQAYGWGAYGAETKGTAEQYANGLTAIKRHEALQNMPPDHQAINDHLAAWNEIEPKIEELRVKIRSAKPTDPVLQWLDQRDELVAKQTEIHKQMVADTIERSGIYPNLYRGEYAWTDPAKEAATPLTGEDLLQWDKPLSEQSPAVRVALTRLARENPGFMAQLERHGMGQVRGDVAYSALQENAARDEKYRRILAGESAPFSLDHSGSQRIASETLREYGIPGIRYLDGMSRDGGSGTYNYVMFDDKGIKLLERNGKPIRGLLNP